MNLPELSLLIVESLTCQRGDRPLFQTVNFSISAGEILQITGSNGVGKSSLLRALSGLLPLATGKLHCSVDHFFIGHQLGLKKKKFLELKFYYML